PAPDRLPSFVEGVELLPGGHSITFDAARGFEIRRYWSLSEFFPRAGAGGSLSPEATSERYAELFEDSVRKCTMSDVPIGAFLSGGVDSSAVAALASRGAPELHCFNVLERSTILNGDAE